MILWFGEGGVLWWGDFPRLLQASGEKRFIEPSPRENEARIRVFRGNRRRSCFWLYLKGGSSVPTKRGQTLVKSFCGPVEGLEGRENFERGCSGSQNKTKQFGKMACGKGDFGRRSLEELNLAM